MLAPLCCAALHHPCVQSGASEQQPSWNVDDWLEALWRSLHSRGAAIRMTSHGCAGVIAGGAVRVVLQAAGIKNGYGKQLGTGNRLNNARACVNCLRAMRTPRQVSLPGLMFRRPRTSTLQKLFVCAAWAAF